MCIALGRVVRAGGSDAPPVPRIDQGFLPADVQTKAIPGGASFAVSRGATGTLRATPRGYALADGAAAPSWLYCLVGEWILPAETCSHRLAEPPPR